MCLEESENHGPKKLGSLLMALGLQNHTFFRDFGSWFNPGFSEVLIRIDLDFRISRGRFGFILNRKPQNNDFEILTFYMVFRFWSPYDRS